MNNLTGLEKNVIDEVIKEIVRPSTPIVEVNDVKYQHEYHSLFGVNAVIPLLKDTFDSVVEVYAFDEKEKKLYRDYIASIKKVDESE